MPTTRSSQAAEVGDYYALNARVYPKFAPFYDAIVRPIRHVRRIIARLSGAGPSSRVLDVATGTGEQAFAFAEAGAHVVGVDISEPMLRIARRKQRRGDVTLLHADATRLPFDDAHFDITSIAFGLHEMPQSIRVATLQEMARVTRAGGTLVVFDYALPRNAVWRALVYRVVKSYERDHYVDFVAIDLPELLLRAGFAVSVDRPFLLGSARLVLATKLDGST